MKTSFQVIVLILWQVEQGVEMIALKIQSIVMVIGFVAFLVISGLTIGLTFVSAFSTGASAMNSVSPHVGDQHCGSGRCEISY